MNDFKTDLEYSMDDAVFDNFYKSNFPGLKEIRFEDNLQKQIKGIDKTLIFKSGLEITIDEKKRRVDYGDILLELYSNKETKRKGWLYTAQCDYMAYAIIPKKKIYFLPMVLLKITWNENGAKWMNLYKSIEAINKNYTTLSIAIPTNVLLDALRKKMICDI